MDQTRWLIVFSMVLVMSLSLALLQKFSDREPLPVAAVESTTVEKAPAEMVEPLVKTPRPTPDSTRRVVFPAPPAHIFAVNNDGEISREADSFTDRGKISQ